MRALIDSDVVLDHAQQRSPHAADSEQVFKWAANNPGAAAVAWHSLANVAYVMRKGDPRTFLKALLTVAGVVAGDTAAALKAVESKMPDIEDAFVVAAAEAFGASYIVTRNTRDYVHSPIRAVTPAEFLQIVAAHP
jgi:predicted nucleic acid-binding protein